MTVEERMFELIKELSGQDTADYFDKLQEDIGLDSLGMVTLLLELEDRFEIHFDESDLNPFDLETVEDVIRLVIRYSGDPNAEER